MKKKWIALCYILFLICLSSCAPKLPPGEAILKEAGKAQEMQEEETLPAVQTEEVPVPTDTANAPHAHSFTLSSVVEATCLREGQKNYLCACGEVKAESIPKLAHDFSTVSCGETPVCKNCGARGEAVRHRFDGNRCTLCGKVVCAPYFVLSQELEFDMPMDSVIRVMGSPTEILTEGDMKSLIYAADLSRFTVVQTDSEGLWGVFTFDPDAFFQSDGVLIRISNFSGQSDPESEASFRDAGSCRIYGFRDHLGSGACYAVWMRYLECDYNFMQDPRMTQNFSAQSRLSYYFVNALRAKNGLLPLTWSPAAATASENYSRKMAQENFFFHDGLYGARLNDAGVFWQSCGENISYGYTNAFFVCDAYYNCRDHRNNILNSSFTHVGMGFFLKNEDDFSVSVLGTQTFYQ